MSQPLDSSFLGGGRGRRRREGGEWEHAMLLTYQKAYGGFMSLSVFLSYKQSQERSLMWSWGTTGELDRFCIQPLISSSTCITLQIHSVLHSCSWSCMHDKALHKQAYRLKVYEWLLASHPWKSAQIKMFETLTVFSAQETPHTCEESHFLTCLQYAKPTLKSFTKWTVHSYGIPCSLFCP